MLLNHWLNRLSSRSLFSSRRGRLRSRRRSAVRRGFHAAEALEQRVLLSATTVPELSSDPLAPATLYLDFDGHYEAEWGAYSDVTTPAYDFDGDPTTFSTEELAAIEAIWQVVAEDYAPFNINVTTVEPSVLAPGVPSDAANGVALRVAIGGSPTTDGGLAYINSFTNDISNVAYVVGSSNTNITGMGVSHEAGHSFGLVHVPGLSNPSPSDPWQPMMASVAYAKNGIWSYGPTAADPNVIQDDMGVIGGSTNGFGWRSDDHGNSVAQATPLTDTGGTWTGSGLIGTGTDADVFSFTVATTNTYSIKVDGVANGQNLDAVLELRNAAGEVIATADPQDNQSAEIRLGLDPGDYFLTVKSTGVYGFVGQYSVLIDVPPGGITVTRPPGIMTTSEDGRQETFEVVLETRPSSDVTIPVSSSNPAAGVPDVASLVFTPENWNVPQVVTITGGDDTVVGNDVGYSIVLGAASSADPEYDGIDLQDVAVVNLDNDESGYLYVLDRTTDTLERMELGGGQVETIVDLAAVFGTGGANYNPRGLSADADNGRLYWVDSVTDSLYASSLNGSEAEVIAAFGSGSPSDTAFDPVTGQIYWSDEATDTIQRANPDGSQIEEVVADGVGGVRKIDVDPLAGKLYWSSPSDNAIKRSNLDGTDLEVVWANPAGSSPVFVAVNLAAGTLHWNVDKVIWRANLDGTNAEAIVDTSQFDVGTSPIQSMEIDSASGKLYWSQGGTLFRSGADGQNIAAVTTRANVAFLALVVHLPPTVLVSGASGLTTSEAGAGASFDVALSSQPTADVTIPVSVSDGTEGSVAVSSLTFTPENWNVPQTVSVTGVDDFVIDGDVSYSVVLGAAASNDPAYDGLDPDDVDVTNLDNDAPIVVFSDSFEVGEWNGQWVEDSQNDWFRSTQRATEGSHSAEVDGSAVNATLTTADSFDLSSFGEATLTFSWYIESGFDSGEFLAFDVSTDSGATWQNDVRRLRGNVDQENTWHHETVDMTPYLGANVRFRFRSTVSGSSEDANVDNVRLEGILAGPPNALPDADAGGPYTVDEGSSVTLDASASSDPDGTIVGYAWDLDGDGQYDDANGATVGFSSNQDGIHIVGVRVTDNAGGTSTATVQVTVNNLPPTANAGGPYAGNEGSTILLDGSASFDPADDIVSYDWDLDGDGQYDDASGISVPFQRTQDGVYTVGLRVTDDAGASSTDTATVTFSNVGPSADAGGPYVTEESVAVLLTAAGSTDPGNDVVSYEWDLDGDGQFDDAAGVTAWFSSTSVGDFTVSVRVTDANGVAAVDSAVVTVSALSTEVVVFEDSFEVGEWNGLWVEDSQNDWARRTQRATDGNYSAEVDGYASNATLTTAQSFDLSNASAATLTFSWYIESGFDSGEYLAFDVSLDGGQTWQNDVRRLNGNQDQENVWHHETVDMSPYLSTSLKFRFRSSVSSSREDANVDNVRLVATGPAAAMVNGGSVSLLIDESQADDGTNILPHRRRRL